jgi:hypothetical protein
MKAEDTHRRYPGPTIAPDCTPSDGQLEGNEGTLVRFAATLTGVAGRWSPLGLGQTSDTP